MSSDTGPSASEIKRLREAIEDARMPSAPYQHVGDRGGNELYKITLAIAGGLSILVLGIFGWVAVHVIEQQDDSSRRLATVEAKLDLLLGAKNGKP